MNMNEKYSNIIALHRPISKRHFKGPHMDRAAQFAPFATLNRHSERIRETANFTDQLAEYDENKRTELDLLLRSLAKNAEKRPKVSLLYFSKDTKKAGGAYIHFTGTLKKIDEYERALVFTDSSKIKTDTICEIFLP